MLSVRQDRHFSSISSTWEPYPTSSQQFWCHPRVQIRTILAFDEQIDILKSVRFPIHVTKNSSNCISPIRVPPVCVRTSFFQEEQRGLHYFPLILAICVVEDVSIYLDMLMWEFWAIWERPPIFTCVCADTASAACPSQSGSLAITSITFAAVVCEADEPCSLNTA